jgi:prevent-host-death family protein
MRSIGAFEAKTHFSALLEQVEEGNEIIITKHGKPVAKLSPIEPQKISREEAIEKIEKFLNERQLVLGMDWKKLRDEGRK